MLKSPVLAFFLATFAATSAEAVTVDFDGIAKPASYSHYKNSGFSTQGFDFHLSFGTVVDSDYWIAKYYAANNGTDVLLHAHNGGDLTVSAGGSLFSLGSVDAGQTWKRDFTDDVKVTGYLGNGKTVSQTIVSKSNFKTFSFDNWNNLWKVTFSGNGYGVYDNFVVKTANTTAVPVPSPLLMLLSALGLVGVMTKRGKTKSA